MSLLFVLVFLLNIEQQALAEGIWQKPEPETLAQFLIMRRKQHEEKDGITGSIDNSMVSGWL